MSVAAALPVPDVKPDAPQRVRQAKRRMLIIVNPYATTVSDRLKSLVVYALQGRYDVEAVSTEAQNHATEIGREAINGDYDIVVAFGGDGTLNEVANGLAGTDIPVSVLPGGSTNVVARTLGIPNDVVDATEHLLGCADRFEPRPIDLGIANGRKLRLRLRRRTRCDRRSAGRLQPADEAPARPLLLHLGGDQGLLRQLPAQPGPDARRERRRRAARESPRSARTPTRSPTSAAAELRVCEGVVDRLRHALARRAEARRPA